MKKVQKQTSIALAAAALLCGVSAASALTVQPKASDSLSLSSVQQKTAWNDLNKQESQNAPAGFKATAGLVVPNTLKIRSVPNKAARDVATLRPYDFAMVQGKLLIVNPHDRMIAEVITG
jgi:hypothetical protein